MTKIIIAKSAACHINIISLYFQLLLLSSLLVAGVQSARPVPPGVQEHHSTPLLPPQRLKLAANRKGLGVARYRPSGFKPSYIYAYVTSYKKLPVFTYWERHFCNAKSTDETMCAFWSFGGSIWPSLITFQAPGPVQVDLQISGLRCQEPFTQC